MKRLNGFFFGAVSAQWPVAKVVAPFGVNGYDFKTNAPRPVFFYATNTVNFC
jgi:hypothetical protein